MPHDEGIWPAGKRFAFSIFDDPDAQTLEHSRIVYGLLSDLGLFTTKGVWPAGPLRQVNSPGETCANPAYLTHVLELQARGFEVGFHHASPHSSTRTETIAALDRFRELFGSDPSSMANHYNEEALYWGADRVYGLVRLAYRAAQLANSKTQEQPFQGHCEASPYFWGDVARARIRYCRNFCFREINTLRMCPWMPYSDPDRPYVPLWYTSTDANCCARFIDALSEANQDRLEAEGGASILYVHFGHAFVENGRPHPRFVELLTRLSRKGGWFVPVTALLDHLARCGAGAPIRSSARARLERAWFLEKVRYGTS